MKIIKLTIFLLLIILLQGTAQAQRAMTTQEYVECYSDEAIDQMKRYGIPASITLAQGLLESGNGGSRLAVKANNHFGIKCKSDWRGDKIYHDDDAKNECFRSYRTPRDSYEDHSIFLTTSPRYASLFEIPIKDYRAWARGLKSAGYATNPKYAELLINLIEANQLYRYDDPRQKPRPGIANRPASRPSTAETKIGVNNGVRYVTVAKGDDLKSISRISKVRVSKLMKFNELARDARLVPGTKIYLEKKKNSSMQYRRHQIQRGDTPHSISQKYGVRLSKILSRNPALRRSTLRIGDWVKL